MSKFKSMLKTSFLAFVCLSFISINHLAAGEKPYPVAEPRYEGSVLIFNPVVEYEMLVLKVSGPDGSVFYKEYDSGSTPYYEVQRAGDGSYTYQLYVVEKFGSMKRKTADDGVSNGRGPDPYGPGLQQTGSFTVLYGKIVTPDGPGEGDRDPGKSMPQGISTTQDFVINDDLIVDGSACIGFDCVNGESFGFDTIRLKENNLRIKFDDTSVAASYPRNDWQITINSSANGGGSYFRVDDISGGRSPFTIEANARSHSLYVDDGGRLGLRTSTPSTEIHTVDGDTPTLRLQQDGSSGFAPQTWDVAGNETNFFIRDVTNGSLLPFRIRPDAPTNSIFVDVDGAIGFGTASPDYRVHLLTNSSTNAQYVAERTSGAQTIFSATNSAGFVGTLNDFPMRFTVDNQQRMQLNNDNSVSMNNGASLTAGGIWTDASSRELKSNIAALSADDALEAFNQLAPVTYNYRSDSNEKHVGFIAEDVPQLVAMNNRKGLAPMEITAVLTKVVQQQQELVRKQQEEMKRHRALIEKLQKQITQQKKESK